MNVDQVRDTVRTKVKVGMEVHRGEKLVGHVTEVCADGLFNSSPKHEQKLKKVEKRY